MKEKLERNSALILILVNIVLISLLLLSAEIYLAYTEKTDNDQNWYEARFCKKAEDNNFQVTDRTGYRNGWDGIYKLDFQSPNIGNNIKQNYNRSGFTGNDLVPVKTEKPKILFIGDSHVFGVAANPILQNRFTSLVEEQGFYTYNAGIGGLDVVQYGLIAKRFIPELKPEHVALMLFLGNDIDRAPSPVAPRKHLYFQTNFDWVQGYDKYGHSFNSAQEAVDYWLKVRCGSSLDPATRFLMKSRLFRKGYQFYLDKIRYLWKEKLTNNGNAWIADTIKGIESLAEQNNASFELFVIPDKNSLTKEEIDDQVLFLRQRGLNPVYPEELEVSDYEKSGNHMLNSGHKKYADFIVRALSQ